MAVNRPRNIGSEKTREPSKRRVLTCPAMNFLNSEANLVNGYKVIGDFLPHIVRRRRR